MNTPKHSICLCCMGVSETEISSRSKAKLLKSQENCRYLGLFQYSKGYSRYGFGKSNNFFLPSPICFYYDTTIHDHSSVALNRQYMFLASGHNFKKIDLNMHMPHTDNGCTCTYDMTLVCTDHVSTKTCECMATMLPLRHCAGLLILWCSDSSFAKKDDTWNNIKVLIIISNY